MPRTRPLTHPVTVTLDGERIEAERGEPLAAALLAAGKSTIARSPKFHRPRGPACFRGACDGCLARVDDTPNVMTCMVAAEDGMEIVSQNRLGPRDVDFLRMTDWFFPDGMNHHELFAGVPGIQTIMQGFARRVAGLGKLPVDDDDDDEKNKSTAPPARRARRRSADVVIVGAGPSGMAIATHLARHGRTVEVIDDQLSPGGGMTALAAPIDAAPFAAMRDAFQREVASGKIRLRMRTTAGAVYGRDLLVAGHDDGAEILDARAIVLACGAHDGQLAFEGNDLPNVMSARAAGWLLQRDGIVVGEKIAVVVSEGGGPFGESFARAHNVELVYGEPIAIRGASRVKGIRVRVKNEEKDIAADTVLIDAPRSPAYELCQQAGATLSHDALRGFVVQTNEGGSIAPGMFAVGEVCGVPLDARAIDADAQRTANTIVSST